MSYTLSAVEQKLSRISEANWNDQYLTSECTVLDRSFIGRLVKILETLTFTKFDWVKNTLYSVNLEHSTLKIKELLLASRKEQSALPEKIKNELHQKVQARFNKLLDRYNAKAPDDRLLTTAYINLDTLFAKTDPTNNKDTPADENSLDEQQANSSKALLQTTERPVSKELENNSTESPQIIGKTTVPTIKVTFVEPENKIQVDNSTTVQTPLVTTPKKLLVTRNDDTNVKHKKKKRRNKNNRNNMSNLNQNNTREANQGKNTNKTISIKNRNNAYTRNEKSQY